ncbi:hypothetical protein CF54_08155 [Streptomyces sp. Tu 6176]|uniref:DUF4874 domain-containing protein n=1 Tax=Streptomyces sp. Tu 6176 TaxID=1470557 RepID=UPI0004458D34|nr:DUF4874 domain-containing protein [Streptomyces sp. Tu 6176]EYT83310.1 hypothetical protein CF54_08155 [Streptomyces sp. Tu 6176]
MTPPSRITRRTLLAGAAAAAAVPVLAAPSAAAPLRRGDWTSVRYRGLCADDPGGRDALAAPHRGFRYEMSYNAIDLTSPWANEQNHSPDVEETLRTLRAEYGEGAHVTQLYFYLWDFATTALPGSALANIERVLAGLRRARTTAVLRFAYDDGVREGRRYTVQHIQAHLRQLAPLVGRYSDVVTVWQAGFLGAWGEWHGSYYDHEDHPDAVTEIMRSLVAALPPTVQTQVRYAEKRQLVGDPQTRDRIGYHNDYITLGEGLWDYYVPGNPGWPDYLAVSPHHPVDGEMPWDKGQSADPYAWSEVIDPVAAARRLQTLRFDTLSMVHNATVTIPGWRTTRLTERQVAAAGLPAATGYFRRRDGRAVERTAFEYLRDHLGYRIEARQARWRRSGAGLDVELDVANTGFAAPKRPRPVRFVLLDRSGRVASAGGADTDWRTWLPSGRAEIDGEDRTVPVTRVRATLPAPRHPGPYRLGLLVTDEGRDGRYGLRLANAGVPVADGVNVLGEVAFGGR